MSRDGRDDFQDDSAVARYVAFDGGGVAPPPDESELDTFARCDAVLAVAPRLADSPELAWAFAEARQLARAAPPVANLPWYRRAGLAWSAAAMSMVATAVLAVVVLLPPVDDAASLAAAAMESSFATAIS